MPDRGALRLFHKGSAINAPVAAGGQRPVEFGRGVIVVTVVADRPQHEEAKQEIMAGVKAYNDAKDKPAY